MVRIVKNQIVVFKQELKDYIFNGCEKPKFYNVITEHENEVDLNDANGELLKKIKRDDLLKCYKKAIKSFVFAISSEKNIISHVNEFIQFARFIKFTKFDKEDLKFERDGLPCPICGRPPKIETDEYRKMVSGWLYTGRVVRCSNSKCSNKEVFKGTGGENVRRWTVEKWNNWVINEMEIT